jgi:hypothetical protein
MFTFESIESLAIGVPPIVDTPTPERSIPSPLFLTQRHHRVEPCRAARRQPAREGGHRK